MNNINNIYMNNKLETFTVFIGSSPDSVFCLLSIPFLDPNSPFQDRANKLGQTPTVLLPPQSLQIPSEVRVNISQSMGPQLVC